MLDDEHPGNAENSTAIVEHKVGTDPDIWRRTCWVHPVTAIRATD